ncbi:MAG: hypothetical protein J6A98_04325 [Clostridia bacterium]|nr:hypothetical protein [Clostridia bacterium]
MDKNFNVYFRDIIVAHVPREKFSYPNGKKIDNGKIEELAIISADGNRFILVNEFEEGIVRNMKDYFLTDTSTLRFIMHTPNIVTMPQNPIKKDGIFKRFNLIVTPLESKAGKIRFEKLEKQNEEIIKLQYDAAIQEYNAEQERRKKLRVENAERAIYNNF